MGVCSDQKGATVLSSPRDLAGLQRRSSVVQAKYPPAVAGKAPDLSGLQSLFLLNPTVLWRLGGGTGADGVL